MSSQTTITTPRRPTASAGAFRLLVLFSPGKKHTGVTVAVGTEPAGIGRAGDGQQALELDDGEISRSHAVVEPVEGQSGHRIRDLGSRNGTFVNGQRVEAQPLAHGDVIRVGSHVLLYQFLTIEAARRMASGRRDDPLLVGDSAALHEVREQIRLAAPLDAPVLILGETGVGKELVAQEVHRQSGRNGPFVPVNCAALPENLIESELFGHAKGAFTGATAPSQGLFGEAAGGTLFLDEIAEMPVGLQAKLLRALATGEVRAVGETRSRKVDVRVVAATNRNLEAEIEAETFRADLYARLMGATVRVPPLRERREDVLKLAEHFLSQSGGAVPLSPDAAEALLIHPWRFNVRELEQTMRAVPAAARNQPALEPEALPIALREPLVPRGTMSPPPPGEVPLVLRIRREGTPSAEELREVLAHFDGNVAQVAAFFGKDRRQIYRWAERHGMDLTDRGRDGTPSGDEA